MKIKVVLKDEYHIHIPYQGCESIRVGFSDMSAEWELMILLGSIGMYDWQVRGLVFRYMP